MEEFSEQREKKERKEIQNELKQWIIRIYLIMKNQHSNKSTNIKKKIIKTAANNCNIEWFRRAYDLQGWQCSIVDEQ